ncbi:MAG: 50S ribosomal protein L3 N(5)-glutamine methyltransferase [Wigglesworthia glossinidia]|nr:50S ribosomal protein L3 N(5)-glutamine methyltransferase [Wigglesworthia glossinidia]
MQKKLNFIKKNLFSIKYILEWTVKTFYKSDIFYGHGTNNARDEALQIILPSLLLPINSSKKILNYQLSYKEKNMIINKIKKRIRNRIPAPYLTHKSWLSGVEFYIDKRVIIPRSPIGELIVDNIRGLINFYPKNILDLCTGSGCLAIISAKQYPKADIDASDYSIEALHVAKINIKKHNLENRIKLIKSNLFNNLSSKKKYDLIITNPPYVKRKSIYQLPKEFLYEPKIGLIGGEDGLKYIRKILNSAYHFLSENGFLICEVGHNMENLIRQYRNTDFFWPDCIDDAIGVFVLTKKSLKKIIT